MRNRRIVLCNENKVIVMTRVPVMGNYSGMTQGREVTSEDILSGMEDITDIPDAYVYALRDQLHWEVINPSGSKDSDIIFMAVKKGGVVSYLTKLKILWSRGKKNPELKKKLVIVGVVGSILLANVIYGAYLLMGISASDQEGEKVLMKSDVNYRKSDPTQGVFDLGREDNLEKGKALVKRIDSLKPKSEF